MRLKVKNLTMASKLTLDWVSIWMLPILTCKFGGGDLRKLTLLGLNLSY